MKTKEILLQIKVTAPERMSNKRVTELIGTLIDIGLADATDTLEEDPTSEDAKDVLKLEITQPEMAIATRR